MKTEVDLTISRSVEPETSVLYIVGTPIGNLNDISIRSTNILAKVSFIACEDTRHTKKMLNALKIKNKLISFNEYNAEAKTKFIIDQLKSRMSVALVSDAGMPLISDPGQYLVKEVRQKNIDVVCSPGPCAALTGLVSSGLVSNHFLFVGFIPRKKIGRQKCLKMIANNPNSSIIYESPKRIKSLLRELKEICGEKRVIHVAKELTKKHEQHWQDSIHNISKLLDATEPKGEYTIILEGKKLDDKNDLEKYIMLKSDLDNLIKLGLKRSSAASYLASKNGLSKNIIYNLR